MTNIWILTNSFPFEPGEQFLETEMTYWADLCKDNVTLIPYSAVGGARDVPLCISVDLCLATSNRKVRIFSIAEAFFSSIFLRELLWLIRKNLFTLDKAYIAWRTVELTYHQYNILRQKFNKSTGNIICYSYWFNTSAYAIALLRRQGLVNSIFVRAHRFDVYEERSKYQYMPLKRQFINDFNRVFTISADGYSYIIERYGASENNLNISRLGVKISDKVTQSSPYNILNILSVSSCRPVKRLDRIVGAIALAASAIGMVIQINWTHIGDGELKTLLEAEARQAFNSLCNVNFRFLGQLSNSEVLNYYETHEIDVFINTSESEGIPVAIMEAMSYSVPVIAPAVGGIPEIVNEKNGWLLTVNPTIEEISEAICLYEHYKCDSTRKTARKRIQINYNAKNNYSGFVNIVSSYNEDE